MGRQLIEHYLLLSQEDLHLWETNPEEFGTYCTKSDILVGIENNFILIF